eukprot:6979213-Alexandrium_andersonii.AAC.1
MVDRQLFTLRVPRRPAIRRLRLVVLRVDIIHHASSNHRPRPRAGHGCSWACATPRRKMGERAGQR